MNGRFGASANGVGPVGFLTRRWLATRLGASYLRDPMNRPKIPGADAHRRPASLRAPRTVAALAVLASLASAGCAGGPEPAPWRLEEAVTTDDALAPLRAGAAAVELDLPPGVPLAGYGGRARRAEWPFLFGQGVLGRLALDAHQSYHEDRPGAVADMLTPNEGSADPVRAKALVLRAGDGAPFGVVSIDICVADATLHERIVELVADLGFTRASLATCATHTHSGPACYLRQRFARLVAMDNFRPEVFEAIARSSADAVRAAHARMRPARIAIASALDGGPDGPPVIAKNRRASKFPGIVDPTDVDREIQLIRIADAASGRDLGAIVNYGVHPTVYGSRSLLLSADLGGAIERAVSARLGGAPVLFVNAAEGDCGPGGDAIAAKSDPEGDAEGPAARCTRLGEALADALEPALAETAAALRTSGASRVRVAGVIGRREFGPGFTFLCLGSRERFLEGDVFPLNLLAAPITLPLNAIFWFGLLINNVRLQATFNLTLAAVVDLSWYAEETAFVIGAWRLTTEGGDDVAFVQVPGEATHDVGLALKAAARARGAKRAVVLGLCNDAMSYIASREKYLLGSYEAHATLFGPDTARRLEEATGDALDELYGPPAEARTQKSSSGALRR